MILTTYHTLSEATNQLRDRGFKNSFKLEGNKMKCLETAVKYDSSEMKIIEYHRFEGESNPSDMSIVFAVKCNDGVKGSIVSSYGLYADIELVNFMEKVKIADRTEVARPI